MERYDGKTRRDDYIKYGLIGLAAVLAVVGLCLLSHFLRRANQKEPDYTVVIGSEEAWNDAMVEQAERLFASLVGDRNGDGEEVVRLEVLRLMDYRVVQAQREERENALEAAEHGAEVSLVENISGVTMDDDFNRMTLAVTTGDCFLYLLSDQPRGDFQGAATTYCKAGYFLELPEDMQDGAEPTRMDLTNAPFLVELGLEDIPFYGCVLDGGSGREEEFAVELLRKLRQATAPMW